MSLRYQGYEEQFVEPGGHYYHFTTIPCPECKQSAKITVNGADLYRYNQGAFIQDAFPYLSKGQRERLMSGVCESCFESMFGEEER